MTATTEHAAAVASEGPAAILEPLDRLLEDAESRGAVAAVGPGLRGSSPVDLEPVAVALALGFLLDASYAARAARLRSGAEQPHPTVGLAVLLARGDPLDGLAQFDPDGPLVESGVIDLVDGRGGTASDQAFTLGPAGHRHLLGRYRLHPDLLGLAAVAAPSTGPPLDALPLERDAARRLEMVRAQLRSGITRVQLVGADVRLARRVLDSLAAGRPVITVDADRIEAGHAHRLARDARALDAVVALRFDREPGEVATDLAGRVPVAVAMVPRASVRLLARGVAAVALPPPSSALRARCWVEAAAAAGLSLAPGESAGLASSYRLQASEIGDAVTIARTGRSLTDCPVPDLADLRDAASELAGRAVDGVARRVEVTHTWHDLVVEPDTRAQLVEMCARARHRDVVLREWGLERTGAAGTHALFSGPSGTGKTAAAQVIAAELGFQLRKVDLAAVVSKYIGETEKNLDAIFEAAADCDVVLLFDEADALFGKRSEVRDAHDRYANLEISYLLQRMEEHRGLTILTTNLRRNLDDAFLRRLAFDVRFPFPDEPARRRLWQQVLGPAVPVEPGLDVTSMAAAYPLSGGQIRNVALAAAYLAAADGDPVRIRHLQLAVRREYQKLGKQLDERPAEEP